MPSFSEKRAFSSGSVGVEVAVSVGANCSVWFSLMLDARGVEVARAVADEATRVASVVDGSRVEIGARARDVTVGTGDTTAAESASLSEEDESWLKTMNKKRLTAASKARMPTAASQPPLAAADWGLFSL